MKMIREHNIYLKKVYDSKLPIGLLEEIEGQSKQSKTTGFWTKIAYKVQFQDWAVECIDLLPSDLTVCTKTWDWMWMDECSGTDVRMYDFLCFSHNITFLMIQK